MKDLPWVDQDSVAANVSIQKVGFNLSDKAKYDEKALVDAMNGAFPGSEVLKKP